MSKKMSNISFDGGRTFKIARDLEEGELFLSVKGQLNEDMRSQTDDCMCVMEALNDMDGDLVLSESPLLSSLSISVGVSSSRDLSIDKEKWISGDFSKRKKAVRICL